MDDRFPRPGGVCPTLAPPAEEVLNAAREAHRAGRLAEAAALFELALEGDRTNVIALYSLGSVLLSLGRAGEALAHCEEAVRLRPDLAAFRDNLGTSLRSLGRLDEARVAYLDAIRLGPGLATAHANLGLIELQEARTDEARRLLERAAELGPDRPVYWEYLAKLYEWIGRFDAAIPCWERILALTPVGRARLHLALGGALHEENRLSEAEAHYTLAAELAPDSAAVRVKQGVLHEERGEFAEAEATFRLAVRLEPDHEAAHASLASLLGGALPDADLDALRARASDPGTAEEPRTRLLFALGRVLDARGDYARAASCLREANALNLGRARGLPRFEPAELDRDVEALIRATGRDFFAKVAGAGAPTRLPVFIVGLPRSGTTLLEQVLSSHPSIHGAGELLLAHRLVESLPGMLATSASPVDCVSLLEPATIRLLAEAYLDRLRSLAEDRSTFVVDKAPQNFLYLWLITVLFPGATVIHCRRDLRDVALSCWMADFGALNWASDPGHIAAYFRAYLRLMDHWRATLPATIHEVRYEEAVSDLEGVAGRLLSALGLDWVPACLEFHRTRRPVRTASRAQVREPLHKRSIGRWKLYEHELADLFAALPRETGDDSRFR